MPIPECIELVPLSSAIHAQITVPGSKSITNRALVLAALATGEVILENALWSEDTQVMVECLRELGFMVNVRPDRLESSNCQLTIYGKGADVPAGGTEQQPLDLFVVNAGTAARFLAAFLCLGRGVYRLHGVTRMHQRPQAALFDALRQLGYRVDSPNGKLPALIFGAGPRVGTCEVSIAESSQFASALILSGRLGNWKVRISDESAEEAPYVRMTEQMISVFPHSGGRFQIEPDASSGSYFLAMDALLRISNSPAAESQISVLHWPTSGWQIDGQFADFTGPPADDSVISRARDLADSIMTAIVLAPFWPAPTRFTDLGRLRLQECERVYALRTELTKCGARVEETGDSLLVWPSKLHGAEIETYNDHRMAMCFAVLGTVVPGIKLRHPECVKKTFPNFFQKLAAPAPAGLGMTILDPATGRPLGSEELFSA